MMTNQSESQSPVKEAETAAPAILWCEERGGAFPADKRAHSAYYGDWAVEARGLDNAWNARTYNTQKDVWNSIGRFPTREAAKEALERWLRAHGKPNAAPELVTLTIDRRLLTRLLDALAEMRHSGGWEVCPGCGDVMAVPPPGRGDAPWAYHQEDCAFRLGLAALQPSVPLTGEQAELLEAIRATDGMEVHRDDWALAEALERRGHITLMGARGPDSAWRRAELVR